MRAPIYISLFVIALLAGPSLAASEARIVVIGDLHGDIDATRRALVLGGAIDQNDNWIGGDLIVVQTGDQIDRGEHDQAVVDLFEELRIRAAKSGGAVYAMLGNHELMNVKGDLRYVSGAGLRDFADEPTYDPADTSLTRFPPEHRSRMAAFLPGRPYALKLAERLLILRLGDNLFVHGGVLPRHVEYGIERINEETHAWLWGEGELPAVLRGSDSPQWCRLYSDEANDDACEVLQDVLRSVSAQRMIVGHTIQELGISAVCDSMVWCVDTGLSEHYGGPMQVLEIAGDELRVLKE